MRVQYLHKLAIHLGCRLSTILFDLISSTYNPQNIGTHLQILPRTVQYNPFCNPGATTKWKT